MPQLLLKAIPTVKIDASGVFKYILIQLRTGSDKKVVVRGACAAEYHGMPSL